MREPLPVPVAEQLTDEKWQQFVDTAFQVLGMPEVKTDQLEPGVYTNLDIATKFRNDPLSFLRLLGQIDENSHPDSKRMMLSVAADNYQSSK